MSENDLNNTLARYSSITQTKTAIPQLKHQPQTLTVPTPVTEPIDVDPRLFQLAELMAKRICEINGVQPTPESIQSVQKSITSQLQPSANYPIQQIVYVNPQQPQYPQYSPLPDKPYYPEQPDNTRFQRWVVLIILVMCCLLLGDQLGRWLIVQSQRGQPSYVR